MSKTTSNVTVPTETDKADNQPINLETAESVETWLKGIDWTTEAYSDELDEDGEPVFLPTPDTSVVSAYSGANQSEKARIRTILTNVKDGYIRKMKPIPARNAQATLDALSTPKAAKAAIDPFALIAARVVNLREAANLLESGIVVPTGLSHTIFDERDMSELWDMVDKTDIDPVVAESIASRKISRTSDKHDIQSVVDRAFEGVESGTYLTIAQIARRGAEADYKPGSGAIAAALFKTSGTRIKGVTPADMTADRPRGAIKD